MFCFFPETFPEKLLESLFPQTALLKSLFTPALPQLNWIRSYKAAFAFSGHEAAAAGERERELVVSAALDRR